MQTFIILIVLVIVIALLVVFGYKKYNGGSIPVNDFKEALTNYISWLGEARTLTVNILSKLDNRVAYPNPIDDRFCEDLANLLERHNGLFVRFSDMLSEINKVEYVPCTCQRMLEGISPLHIKMRFNFILGAITSLREGFERLSPALPYEYRDGALPNGIMLVRFDLNHIYGLVETYVRGVYVKNKINNCLVCQGALTITTGSKTKPAQRRPYDEDDAEEALTIATGSKTKPAQRRPYDEDDAEEA